MLSEIKIFWKAYWFQIYNKYDQTECWIENRKPKQLTKLLIRINSMNILPLLKCKFHRAILIKRWKWWFFLSITCSKMYNPSFVVVCCSCCSFNYKQRYLPSLHLLRKPWMKVQCIFISKTLPFFLSLCIKIRNPHISMSKIHPSLRKLVLSGKFHFPIFHISYYNTKCTKARWIKCYE